MSNDPLDAIWMKATPKMSEEELDKRLTAYINRMPKDLQRRLREIIDSRIENAVREAKKE